MMDFARRIQKLKELNQRPFCETVNNKWPSDIDHELILGLQYAEKEASKTAELLGMIESLEKGHVLTRTSDGDIAMLNPDTDVYPVNSVDTPDETNIFEVEDLLNIENDQLLNAIDENQNEVSTALINVAVSARQNSAADKVENGNDDEEEDDEDSPPNCFFYSSAKCRHRDSTFKAPQKTEWLGCEFPGCKKWLYQVCLGLKFTTQQEKQSYTYYCKDHPTTYYSSENKVVTSKCDKNMLETDSPTISKRARVLSGNNNGGQDLRTTNPSYIEYNGTYFQISEFLSIQQGKVYTPSTSRNARWMAVSKVNYYDNIDKIAASPNQEDMHCKSYAAFWMGDQGLVIVKVVRMLCSPTTESAYPILQCKKDDPRSNVVTCCVNVAPIDVKSDTWSLQLKDCFMFCPMKALLIQLRVIDREQGLEVNTNDIAKIRSKLPQLHEAEKKRKEGEVKDKEASLRKRKEGPSEEMSVVLSKEVLKEMGISIRNSSTKAQLVEKVKQALAGQLEANGNCCQFGTSFTTITLNGGFSDQSYDNKRYVQPCLYLLFYDPTEKRRVLFIILMSIIYSLIQMFSEFSNHQFLSII